MVIRIRYGRVLAITKRMPGVTVVSVRVEGQTATAVNYDDLTGPIAAGDEVVLNTTAVHIGLGTGGDHFVMAVLGRERDLHSPGHIMKCRYTPSQVAVLTAEEQVSPYHDLMQDGDLGGMPVVVATLHSMVAAMAVTARRLGPPNLRLVYIMTDGGSLAARGSRLVHRLKEAGFIDAVITYGHAFGGDVETVTLYSALLAAKVVCSADLIFVAMGPGVVGTGTTWGTTALEQGVILDGVHVMAGRAIAVPRLSFADPRQRHSGISHHSLTALGRVAAHPCEVALPTLHGTEAELVADRKSVV